MQHLTIYIRNLIKNPYISATILALIYIFYLFNLKFLSGEGGLFDGGGDVSQHISGWLYYLKSPWQFPLLHTNRLNTPEGVSIAFTDSIPIMAITAKAFSFLIPKNFHYFGYWHAIAFLLQAISSVYIIRSLNHYSLFHALIAVIFALLSPALLNRIGHTSLLTHGLLLIVIGTYIRVINQKISDRKGYIILILFNLISLLVHPYLFAMSYLLIIGFIFDCYRCINKSLKTLSWRIILLNFCSLITMAVFGYFGSANSASGYGYYSMNLSAPFCGGVFLHCQYDGTGGQYEGYNYLGIGVILLIILALIIKFSSKQHQLDYTFASFKKKHLGFAFILILMTAFAISNKIFIGSHLLFTFELEKLEKIASIFRSSGRFFWPVGYTILFYTLHQYYKKNSRFFNTILVIALILQWFDVRNTRNKLIDATRVPSKRNLTIQKILENFDEVYFFPTAFCGDIPPQNYIKMQLDTAFAGATLNTGYLSRALPKCAEKTSTFETATIQKGRIYITERKNIEKKNTLPLVFRKNLQTENCITYKELVFCGTTFEIKNLREKDISK